MKGLEGASSQPGTFKFQKEYIVIVYNRFTFINMLGCCPFPAILAKEALGWETLLENVTNPGGDYYSEGGQHKHMYIFYQ